MLMAAPRLFHDRVKPPYPRDGTDPARTDLRGTGVEWHHGPGTEPAGTQVGSFVVTAHLTFPPFTKGET